MHHATSEVGNGATIRQRNKHHSSTLRIGGEVAVTVKLGVFPASAKGISCGKILPVSTLRGRGSGQTEAVAQAGRGNRGKIGRTLR